MISLLRGTACLPQQGSMLTGMSRSGVWFHVLLAIRSVSLSPAPPLTLESILKEVEGVKNENSLCRWLSDKGAYYTYGVSIKDAVERFLKGQGYFQPSWRAVIFALDGARETHHANRIRHYAEPVQGRYMLCD